jgi:hypothetical protein
MACCNFFKIVVLSFVAEAKNAHNSFIRHKCSELFEVPVVNFDILDVRRVENPLHKTVLNLLQK